MLNVLIKCGFWKRPDYHYRLGLSSCGMCPSSVDLLKLLLKDSMAYVSCAFMIRKRTFHFQSLDVRVITITAASHVWLWRVAGSHRRSVNHSHTSGHKLAFASLNYQTSFFLTSP